MIDGFSSTFCVWHARSCMRVKTRHGDWGYGSSRQGRWSRPSPEVLLSLSVDMHMTSCICHFFCRGSGLRGFNATFPPDIKGKTLIASSVSSTFPPPTLLQKYRSGQKPMDYQYILHIITQPTGIPRFPLQRTGKRLFLGCLIPPLAPRVCSHNLGKAFLRGFIVV